MGKQIPIGSNGLEMKNIMKQMLMSGILE